MFADSANISKNPDTGSIGIVAFVREGVLEAIFFTQAGVKVSAVVKSCKSA